MYFFLPNDLVLKQLNFNFLLVKTMTRILAFFLLSLCQISFPSGLTLAFLAYMLVFSIEQNICSMVFSHLQDTVVLVPRNKYNQGLTTKHRNIQASSRIEKLIIKQNIQFLK